mmetsp:Transcript_22918/g.52500  ORF Transcript_22918/g.52500 Transcript_22918/m.52500 type:complete len:369 (-) Transcript_22918:159-1265(-)
MTIITLLMAALTTDIASHGAEGFVLPLSGIPRRTQQKLTLNMVSAPPKTKKGMGKGMGMGVGVGKKVSKNQKNKQKVVFDAASAYLRSEKNYDEYLVECENSATDGDGVPALIAREYMVTARFVGSKSLPGASSLHDWTPAAHLIVASSTDSPSDPEAAAERSVSSMCREIHHALVVGNPSVASLPRSEIQYAFEPLQDFFDHVYEAVIADENNGGTSDEDERPMLKSEARSILGLEADADAAALKSAYRKLTLKCHPDRFAGEDVSEQEAKEAAVLFHSAQRAYDSLGAGTSGDGAAGSSSWFESLGGRARTNFSGPLSLSKIGEPGAMENLPFNLGGYKTSISAVTPEVTMMFVARNQAAASEARR